MPTFRFDKLVRDRIVELQQTDGYESKYRKLNRDEHIAELIKKLSEEVSELEGASPDKLAAELADVQQVLDDLAALLGVAKEEISAAQEKRLRKAGGFSEGLYVETLTMSDDAEWLEYYRENADRYPEV